MIAFRAFCDFSAMSFFVNPLDECYQRCALILASDSDLRHLAQNSQKALNEWIKSRPKIYS